LWQSDFLSCTLIKTLNPQQEPVKWILSGLDVNISRSPFLVLPDTYVRVIPRYIIASKCLSARQSIHHRTHALSKRCGGAQNIICRRSVWLVRGPSFLGRISSVTDYIRSDAAALEFQSAHTWNNCQLGRQAALRGLQVVGIVSSNILSCCYWFCCRLPISSLSKFSREGNHR
jgi:hypothetical protein